MAKPSDLSGEIVAAAENVADLAARRADRDSVRRQQALQYRLAGFSYEAIGERLGISTEGASQLIRRTLSRAENSKVEEQRALENERLDRLQSAIWAQALQGDMAAIRSYLAISTQRAKLNGLYAPTKIDLAVGVRQEMEQALSNLEAMVLGGVTVIEGSVDDSSGGTYVVTDDAGADYADDAAESTARVTAG